MRIYLKLRSGAWMLITKKIEQTTTSGGKKRLTRHILAGISVNSPPGSLSEWDFVKVPASIINKVISRLLDVDDNAVAVAEPLNVGHYVIKVPPGKGKIVESILSEIVSGRKGRSKEGKETS
ncbi:MAG: hypothetical protein QXH02_00620 [Desulfurococcaceae archaeon]